MKTKTPKRELQKLYSEFERMDVGDLIHQWVGTLSSKTGQKEMITSIFSKLGGASRSITPWDAKKLAWYWLDSTLDSVEEQLIADAVELRERSPQEAQEEVYEDNGWLRRRVKNQAGYWGVPINLISSKEISNPIEILLAFVVFLDPPKNIFDEAEGGTSYNEDFIDSEIWGRGADDFIQATGLLGQTFNKVELNTEDRVKAAAHSQWAFVETGSNSEAFMISADGFGLLNWYIQKLLKEPKLVLTAANRDDGPYYEWPMPHIFKNFRMPYPTVRIIEETSDLTGLNQTSVINQLVLKGAGTLAQDSVNQAIQQGQSQLAVTGDFSRWAAAVVDFAEVGCVIPRDLPTGKTRESKTELVNEALEGLHKTVATLSEEIKMVRDYKVESIPHDAPGEDLEGGHSIQTSSDGIEVERVSEIDADRFLERVGEIEVAMYRKPANFRGEPPRLFRAIQGGYSYDRGVTKPFGMDVFVGYKIKLSQTEIGPDHLVEELNEWMAQNVSKKAPKVTLAMLQYANQVETIASTTIWHAGRRIIAPDPRTIDLKAKNHPLNPLVVTPE